MQQSEGNVFQDLGFRPEESENLRVRADLMIELRRLIECKKWTQAAAARIMGVSQPRISDLVRGKIDRFSIDSLVVMLGRTGANVLRVSCGGTRVDALASSLSAASDSCMRWLGKDARIFQVRPALWLVYIAGFSATLLLPHVWHGIDPNGSAGSSRIPATFQRNVRGEELCLVLHRDDH